ncbi:MAG TPA: cytochrome c [Candidatus Sulfotelmatobacter sp.]|nr:cytochrome c [Candidatus Sulfotelmatobacter sp.]
MRIKPPHFLPGLLLILSCGALPFAQGQASPPAKKSPVQRAPAKVYSAEVVKKGSALFRQNCSFCHGRDATGGETGPDLTRSKLVTADVNGNKIAPVVRNGRPDKGMPHFELSDDEIHSLVAFIHTQQQTLMASANGRRGAGGRKGVDPSDLQTGNAEAGRQYFNGAGGCAKCHSATGDLAGIASRFQGLQLEQQMLYPRHVKSKVSVTVSSGETISGTLSYLDEFTVGLTDADGTYRSWRTSDVKYEVDDPVSAHVDMLDKYTDDDIHNLMAYLQTLH